MSTQVSQAFDPYHRWLGIPPKDQPPHHYRLLGIEAFEQDADVIESAADRQMKHVRSFQTGNRSQLSQQMLTELSTAKVCLLDPAKKAAYDQQLRGRLTPGEAVKPSAKGRVAAPPVPPLPMSAPAAPLDPLPPSDPLEDLEPFPAVLPAPEAAPSWNALPQPQPVFKRPAARPLWRQPAVLAGVSAAVVLVLLMAAVVVIRLATDTGELIIEAAEPGVEVAVKRSGDVVESIKMDQRQKSFTINSGKYEIELTGGDVDGLQVDAKEIVLRRGEKVVVRITRRERPVVDERQGAPDIAAPSISPPSISPPSISPPSISAPDVAAAPSGGLGSLLPSEQPLEAKPEVPETPRVAEKPDVVDSPAKPPVALPSLGGSPSAETDGGGLASLLPGAAPKLGKGPYALEFDGREYVELADTNVVASWNSTFTAEMWVQWQADDNKQTLMGTHIRPPAMRTTGGWNLGVAFKNGEHKAFPTVNLGGSIVSFTPTERTWHHVAFVHDDQGSHKTYMDGTRVSRGGTPYEDKEQSNLCLGVPRYDDMKAGFHGAIRAFRLSSKARYDDEFEVPESYEFEQDADTVVLLDFSRAEGARIEDLSGNGHHGTISGARWITIE